MRRRDFIAVAGSIVTTGCLGSEGYNVEAVKSEAKQIPYNQMTEGDRIHVKRGQVEQVQAGDSTRYFIYTEKGEDGWTKDVFATWEGKQFSEGDTVEFWGVVEGSLETEDGRRIPQVTIVDMQSAE